jgi:hypothetical protein
MDRAFLSNHPLLCVVLVYFVSRKVQHGKRSILPYLPSPQNDARLLRVGHSCRRAAICSRARWDWLESKLNASGLQVAIELDFA